MDKKKENIERLRALEVKAQKRLVTIRLKLESIFIEEEIPKMRKKYAGKYWVYENGFDSERRWPLYSFVKEVKSSGMRGHYTIIVDQFQTDTNGTHEFKANSSEHDFHCQRQITKREYMKALRKFQRKCTELISGN